MDFTNYFKFIFVLSFVLGLILLFGWLMKRFGPGRLVMSGLPGQKRRLRFKEILPVDPKNRFVLLECDDREFLILVGQENSCVISETNNPHPSSESHEDYEGRSFKNLLSQQKIPFPFSSEQKKSDHDDNT